jgi:transcription initiation factor IIE alpha subunit
MAPRLNLPAKRLRQTLQFLQDEHLVYSEPVHDLAQGGSQATRFYYLDCCRAVHTIRLRVHLLQRKLEHAELRAQSSSHYLCPGYKIKRCTGRYSEEEAQQVLDPESGLFLCGACSASFSKDPNPPPLETYTLQLVDNT